MPSLLSLSLSLSLSLPNLRGLYNNGRLKKKADVERIDLRGETLDKEIVTSSLARPPETSIARREILRRLPSPSPSSPRPSACVTAVIKFVRFWQSQDRRAARHYTRTLSPTCLLLPPDDLKVRGGSPPPPSPVPLLSPPASTVFPCWRRRHLRSQTRRGSPAAPSTLFLLLASRGGPAFPRPPADDRHAAPPSLPLAPEESGSTPQGLHKGAWGSRSFPVRDDRSGRPRGFSNAPRSANGDAIRSAEWRADARDREIER